MAKAIQLNIDNLGDILEEVDPFGMDGMDNFPAMSMDGARAA